MKNNATETKALKDAALIYNCDPAIFSKPAYRDYKRFSHLPEFWDDHAEQLYCICVSKLCKRMARNLSFLGGSFGFSEPFVCSLPNPIVFISLSQGYCIFTDSKGFVWRHHQLPIESLIEASKTIRNHIKKLANEYV